MVYAIRRPSGESSTLPTDRKREMSLLARPWAALQGVEARSVTAKRNPETTRRRTKRNCECMKSTPEFRCDVVLAAFRANKKLFISNIDPSTRPSSDKRPSGEPDRRENARVRGW